MVELFARVIVHAKSIKSSLKRKIDVDSWDKTKFRSKRERDGY